MLLNLDAFYNVLFGNRPSSDMQYKAKVLETGMGQNE